ADTWKDISPGLLRLPLHEPDLGFTLSGPVVIPKIYNGRNRTFFFTAYEFDTLLDSAVIDTLVPVQQNSLFPLPAPTNLSGQRNENASSPALNAVIAPFVTAVSPPSRNHISTTPVHPTLTEMTYGTI